MDLAQLECRGGGAQLECRGGGAQLEPRGGGAQLSLAVGSSTAWQESRASSEEDRIRCPGILVPPSSWDRQRRCIAALLEGGRGALMEKPYASLMGVSASQGGGVAGTFRCRQRRLRLLSRDNPGNFLEFQVRSQPLLWGRRILRLSP